MATRFWKRSEDASSIQWKLVHSFRPQVALRLLSLQMVSKAQSFQMLEARVEAQEVEEELVLVVLEEEEVEREEPY